MFDPLRTRGGHSSHRRCLSTLMTSPHRTRAHTHYSYCVGSSIDASITAASAVAVPISMIAERFIRRTGIRAAAEVIWIETLVDTLSTAIYIAYG